LGWYTDAIESIERMIFMKRWFSSLLAALLLLALTACGAAQPGFSDEGPRLEEELTELPMEDAAPEDISGGDAPSLPDDADPVPTAPDTLGTEALPPDGGNTTEDDRAAEEDALPENGSYTTKEDVALYIHLYGRLPDNFITKKEAQNLGWPGGSLEPYAPGMCIGGSRFGNYEGLLPEAEGRSYTECDIDTLGAKSRGAKRIVFSNDGLIYYTEDHYESFELLYGEENDG